MSFFKKARQQSQRRESQRAQASQRSSAAESWTEIEKIVVVTKKTPLEDLILRMNSKSQAKFYLEQNQVSFTEYEKSDAQYQRSVEAIKQQLPKDLKQYPNNSHLLPSWYN